MVGLSGMSCQGIFSGSSAGSKETEEGCEMLQQAQRFEVTALVDGMSEVRSVNVIRQVVSITIIDDSRNDSKPGQLTFAFFMDLPLSKEDAATMNILQAVQAAKVRTLSVRTLSVI